MTLANWKMVCRPKEYGGLGIAYLVTFNKALHMKWSWYWQKPEQRMWIPVFQGTMLNENLMPVSPLFTGALQECHNF